ncbi:MAG: zf-HC2 domain-containing protein [Acidobacteriota bacterium]
MNCEEIEVSLSGYLDNELTQQESQRIELHLETCAHCRQVLEELREAQQAAQKLELAQPSHEEWKHMENHILEKSTRGLGWVILIVWSIITAAYAIFQFAMSPSEPLFEKILVFSLFLGIALLFLSVLSERIRESRTDRYKGVQK